MTTVGIALLRTHHKGECTKCQNIGTHHRSSQLTATTIRIGRGIWIHLQQIVLFLSMQFDWSHGDLFEGRRCYHAGSFFEAHEHWEAVWLAAQDPEKTFLQGLIQVAAALHHFQGGSYAGAISLLRSALRRLDPYPEHFAGIKVASFRVDVRAWLEALETGAHASPPVVPQLNLTS